MPVLSGKELQRCTKRRLGRLHAIWHVLDTHKKKVSRFYPLSWPAVMAHYSSVLKCILNSLRTGSNDRQGIIKSTQVCRVIKKKKQACHHKMVASSKTILPYCTLLPTFFLATGGFILHHQITALKWQLSAQWNSINLRRHSYCCTSTKTNYRCSF